MSLPTLEDLARETGLDLSQVFGAPWEARAFAIALNLSQAGLFSWEEFRAHLIAHVAKGDRARERDGTANVGRYYHRFVDALLATVAEKGIASADDLARKLRELESNG
jgi:nitrile hydratase accessory protein